MNKTDCEKIGFILSTCKGQEELMQRLFALDPRVEPEYQAYEAVQGRREGVDKLYNEKMTARLGPSWCLMKAAKDISKQVLEEARREVYGEDYHPSFFT